MLKDQCKHLAKEGNLLKKKALRYKEISETRGSNLQKAELEVRKFQMLTASNIVLFHYTALRAKCVGGERCNEL